MWTGEPGAGQVLWPPHPHPHPQSAPTPAPAATAPLNGARLHASPTAVRCGVATVDTMVDTSKLFVTLVLNGSLVVQLNLPPDAGVAELAFDIPEGKLGATTGATYLNSVVTVPTPVSRSYTVSLTVGTDPDCSGDNAVQCNLGTVNWRALSGCYFDFLPFVATHAILRVAGQPSAQKKKKDNPVEARFVNSAVELLQSTGINPGGGSMSTSILLNQCKTLPLYEEIVGKHYKHNFHQFVKNHPERLTLFQLNHVEVQEKGVFPFVKPTESRVVMVAVPWEDSDAVRAQGIAHHTAELARDLTEYLRARGTHVAHNGVVADLADNEHFLYLSQPSLSLLKNFLMVHTDKFVVVNHPHLPHGTVGVNRATS
eukprot:TRINITY_DN3024_c1_g1_i1.p1 TRINITY_DN3024_c1_g1~~TRINITY_DN3024_c1_g1_i1.p1  ORF type:complete len:370 (+),score=69.71 TRINITY_DN3024_c1_g1_i1:99-1208(+)